MRVFYFVFGALNALWAGVVLVYGSDDAFWPTWSRPNQSVVLAVHVLAAWILIRESILLARRRNMR